MNLYQITAANNPENLQILQTFQYLCDLNSDLGKIHDEYVDKEIKGIIKYEKAKLKIPKKLKQRLENFYNFLEK